jgi:18S rRNA (guanine1575-N7)-methyltransferase
MSNYPRSDLETDRHSLVVVASSHISDVQTRLTERAIELLGLNGGSKLLLDIGCGSGLSGEVISEYGHTWIGADISSSMLDVALERGVEGDLFHWDMGHGMTFRPGTFDGAISISAVQWLCNADKKCDNPIARIKRFFGTLYNSLARGARAVLQAYPQDAHQMDLLASAAFKAGFGGGWLVDFPNSTRAKKYYLVLFAGVAAVMPKHLDGEETNEAEGGFKWETKRLAMKKEKWENRKFGKKWILAKKERARRQGKEVCHDSKYSGRRRRNQSHG